MRSREEVGFVLELVRAGWNDCEIARESGIPGGTIRDWRHGRTPDFERVYTFLDCNARSCVVCGGDPLTLPKPAYTYLLGLYLGDGYIAAHARGVFRLRVYCADAYPELIQRCEDAMAEVLPNKVSRIPKVGCTEVAACSKHWPCLFPQHGPGRKHERTIALTPWQQELVDLDPRPLLPGAAALRRVPGPELGERHAVSADHFSNVSTDIRGIFGRACDQLGIEWRPNNPFGLSVARRDSVALLDGFVGPKR